jgi:hypothetical protein
LVVIIVFNLGVSVGILAEYSGLLNQVKSLLRPIWLETGTLLSTPSTHIIYDRDNELLRFAFVDELMLDDKQIYPPSGSIEQVSRRINDLLIDASLFPDAYRDIKILDTLLEEHIFSLHYNLQRNYTTYSYFVSKGQNTDCAILIIPGSGHNQSSKIFRKDVNNYHKDIVNITEKYCVTFIYVKPNEDFISIHNGEKKLSYEFVINYLVNYGGSYSARYLIDTLAITKYLKNQYERVVVIGLSQGGRATLLNSMQSEPTVAIVASGFTTITTTINWSGHQGIMIPNLFTYFNNNEVVDVIDSLNTHYLFTYGKQERASYKIEAEEEYACNLFKGLDNVTCLSHAGGHTFPQPLIESFLSLHLGDIR